MKFRVSYTAYALKQFSKLDRNTQILIQKWVKKHLEGCEDPRIFGKGLTANRSGQWRYRIGDYRLICDINDNEVIITVITVGHRSKIYDK